MPEMLALVLLILLVAHGSGIFGRRTSSATRADQPLPLRRGGDGMVVAAPPPEPPYRRRGWVRRNPLEPQARGSGKGIRPGPPPPTRGRRCRQPHPLK